MNYTAEQTADLHSQTFAHLIVEERDHVLHLRLNRPEKKNALDPVLLRELAFALHYARFEKSIRAVVLAAEGDVFCSGADLKAFMGAPSTGESTIPAPQGQILIGEVFKSLHRPCIAQVEGPVFAGGFLLLAGCTHVVAAEGIRLGLPEVKRGLFPYQVMASLIELLPARKVLDWCMRGYDLPVETAYQWGLVTHIAAPGAVTQTVDRLLGEILENSPSAIRMGLEAYQEMQNLPKEKQHSYLMGMLMKTIQTPDAREGILAFKEKRKPVWTGE